MKPIEITDRDHELYNKAAVNYWDNRLMLLAIATAREEGRQEQREETARHAEQLVRSTCADAIVKAHEKERSRWLAWATDLGYDEQELQWLLGPC